MVVTWIGHVAISLLAVAFMMLAIGVPLFFGRRPPASSCGRTDGRDCPCTGSTRSTCEWTTTRGAPR